MVVLKIFLAIIVFATCVGLFALIKELFPNSNGHKPYGPYERCIKRFLDAFLSTVVLIVFSPILIILAILVRAKLGSPILFTQDRPGKDEKIFKLYKFRTMTDEKDENGYLLPDSVRLTRFGKKLRATSLDELPELINILKGDMSIVGPRPLLPSYLPYYTDDEHHRHDVRPGLSGLAQSCGRSFISWKKIFEYDLQYIKHITFFTDCKIVIRTVKNVIKKKDVADFSNVYIGEDGRKHVKIDSEEITIHMPLDEERSLKSVK